MRYLRKLIRETFSRYTYSEMGSDYKKEITAEINKLTWLIKVNIIIENRYIIYVNAKIKGRTYRNNNVN